MGATAADTKREIEEIRKDVLSATVEVRRRVAHALSPGTYVELAREHPAAVAGLGLTVVSVAGAIATRSAVEARRRNRPTERLKRTVFGAANEIGEQLERARAALPTSLPIEVRLGSRDDDDSSGKTRELHVMGSQPGMVKRLLWAALVAAMMAGGGLIARRVSATVWRAAMREEPPTKSV